MKGYQFADDVTNPTNYEEVNERFAHGFTLYLLILLLILAVTFSFMVNVMEFGEKLVGIEVTSPVDVRIFEKAQRKIAASIDNATKAAKLAAGAK